MRRREGGTGGRLPVAGWPPARLAAGCRWLAAGATGYWLLATGCWLPVASARGPVPLRISAYISLYSTDYYLILADIRAEPCAGEAPPSQQDGAGDSVRSALADGARDSRASGWRSGTAALADGARDRRLASDSPCSRSRASGRSRGRRATAEGLREAPRRSRRRQSRLWPGTPRHFPPRRRRAHTGGRPGDGLAAARPTR